MTSLRIRLLVGLLALVVAVSLLAGLVTYRRVLEETSTLFDYQLRQMALSLRNQISIAPRVELPPEQGDSDFVIQIWDAFGARVYLSRPGLPMINRATLGYDDMMLQRERWRVYSLQTIDGVIQVAQPWRVREQLAGEAALRVALPLLLLLPLMAAAVAWIVGRSLRPLERATLEVQRRDVHSLSPIEASNLPKEVAPLIAELNRLLVRLAEAFDAQRAFVADAAHELRSPLTALRLQLQLLVRAPDETARETARGKLGAAIERSMHLVEQLLTLARNEPEGARSQLQPLALDEVARVGIADAHALAAERSTELSLDAPDRVTVQGDGDALRILVRNLIDNALRYTPANGCVRVHVVAEPGGGAWFTVDDSGPGIPPGERERAFDRFTRRDGSPEGGSGLGLAIVKAIASRHGATVTLGESPLRGLHVAVSFPAKQSAPI
jgi:two-component system OmpR family sensor kinase/two-component system sensor histidine kinase QseC